MAEKYRPKEISWLSFNERVLFLANNFKIPLLERIKFLAIYSSNLDEFFRVRVATLTRLSKLGEKAEEIIGHDPSETLKKINEILAEQNNYYEKTRKNIRTSLKKNKVEIIDETQLSESQIDFLMDFYRKDLKNSLMPIILNDKKNIPDLVDDNIYFAIKIIKKNEENSIYAILQLPTHKFDRFIILPQSNDFTQVIYLDDVVRLGLSELFYFIEHEKIESYAFKVTKDAELDIEDDISSTYIELVDKSLKKRKKGNAVRFNYDKNMSKDIHKYIVKYFKIHKGGTQLAGGRYHNTRDFIDFPNILGEKAIYKKLPYIPIKDFENQKNFFDTLQKKDILLHYPYHSFNYFIDFLKEASVDQYVVSIKVTLYRLSKNSDIISVLLNAVRNGKKVTVVIELQARFDEVANIHWSEELTEGGVKVIYGVQGLKVHSKLTLIERCNKGNKEHYVAVGTGNYNETTAKLYTDFTLLTTNKKITRDIVKLFDFLKDNYKHFDYKSMLVSPFNAKERLLRLIDNEIKNAKAGKKAFIHIKINNIEDRKIISKLYEASQNGVEVVLLVRGMLSLVTELPDFSDKIVARGIVDRYLEHTRLMIFGNNKNPLVFITSADLMIRNLNRRVEVGTPIYDKKIKKQLIDIFNIHLSDNTSARILDKHLTNKLYTNDKKKVNAQLEVYKYLSNLD